MPEDEIYNLITLTLNIAGHLDNPDYHNQITKILEKERPYLSKRFMSIMGILIAIRKNLYTDLIAINRIDLPYENKIEILTNFEEISIDFPKKMLEMGKSMAEVYFNLFIFENHIRYFIEEVSIKSYGTNYWKKLKINPNIGNKIRKRKKDEILYRWLSTRGDSDLFYTDFDDLRVIISSNWVIFQNYFPKENWIITYLEDLYRIRNKIAHNIPIEENEKNTVETLLNNIYNQLEVDLKYIKFFSEESRQIIFREYEDEDDYYLDDQEEYQELYEIDFELIFDYLDMLEKGEIPYENITNTFNALDREVQKLSRIDIINQHDITNFEEICKRFLNYMKDIEEYTEHRVLSVLFSFTYSTKTSEILKNQGYSYLVSLFEKGKQNSTLLRILDLFGYFDHKIGTLLISSIEKNDTNLLNNLLGAIDFSRYKDKRKDFIRTLNKELAKNKSDNPKLVDVIKEIIRKFE